MSWEIEKQKFLAADSEKATQQTVRIECEPREQADERALLVAEFRKVASQLGELRRRETHLLRRTALLEIEGRQKQASVEAQSAESARLKAEVAGARHSIEAQSAESAHLKAELAGARHSIEAQSAESAHLKAELAEYRHRLAELDQALEAQTHQLKFERRQGDARRRRTEELEAQLQLVKASTSWRLTRPLRWVAGKFPWFTRQLKRLLKFVWGVLAV
jgi:chromosome segregation ATPase